MIDQLSAMTEVDVLGEFRAADALLDGHFILSSGLHSTRYLQCARIFADPRRAARLCAALAAKLQSNGLIENVSLIVSPAMGGVIAGYEMGRQLSLPAIFVERVNGVFELRRGFEIKPGQACLIVEDVVTTGLSTRECASTISALGGVVHAACALVNRSGGAADVGVPLVSLLDLDILNYPSDQLPDALKQTQPTKPGSRTTKV